MNKQKITLLILSIIIISFFLNLIWEISHSVLYDWNASPLENSVYFYVPRILMASLGDIVYILIIFLLVSAFNGDLFWIYSLKYSDYLLLIAFGITFAIFIEIKASVLNLWSYNQSMPTILGIGITPLIQLAITSILAVLIVNKLKVIYQG